MLVIGFVKWVIKNRFFFLRKPKSTKPKFFCSLALTGHTLISFPAGWPAHFFFGCRRWPPRNYNTSASHLLHFYRRLIWEIHIFWNIYGSLNSISYWRRFYKGPNFCTKLNPLYKFFVRWSSYHLKLKICIIFFVSLKFRQSKFDFKKQCRQ